MLPSTIVMLLAVRLLWIAPPPQWKAAGHTQHLTRLYSLLHSILAAGWHQPCLSLWFLPWASPIYLIPNIRLRLQAAE